MQSQLKTLRIESKGKGSSKSTANMDEVKYLMASSIAQAAAKTMEHLSEFVFISMGNLTLVRRDAYLTHMKSGIKPDTIAALRTSRWTIRPMFDQSSVSWYNHVRSLTTSRNRLNLRLTLLYVSQYPRIFLLFKLFSKLSFNKLIDFSRILCLFITTTIFTGSGCFW